MVLVSLPRLILVVLAATATSTATASPGSSGATATPHRPLSVATPTSATDVHTVHVVFSHHLDIGLNEALRFVGFCRGFATKIIQEYFDDFIPRAIRIAKETNGESPRRPHNATDSFAYTIHPWIASLYVDCVPWDIQDGCPSNPGQLKCPSADEVAAFDAAVLRGDLLWADSPFNVNPGIVGEPSFFEALFDIASALNERYNLTKTHRVWSNIDVPGFTRSSIPLLKKAGATALSVCANVGNQGGPGNGSVPNEMVRGLNATMWRWHDPASDEEILVLYHKAQRDTIKKIPLRSEFNTYGGYSRPDNILISPEGGTALASYIAADNTGPPMTTNEVRNIFKTVHEVFPNAKSVFGSTWDHFTAAITPAEVATLPRFSSAWGDPWVLGMSSDPGRLQTYRAIIRARAACLASGKCPSARDPVMRNFTRFAAKNAEHTQGVEGGGMQPGSQLCIWLSLINIKCPGDNDWKNDQFREVHRPKRNIFPGADDSWLEARVFSKLAIEAVPSSHPLAPFLQRELAALLPQTPNVTMEDVSAVNKGGKAVGGKAVKAGKTVTCQGTVLEFDSTGSLANLTFGGRGGSWSRLMDLRYISAPQCDKKGMCCSDASKCPNPQHGATAPVLLGFWSDADANADANANANADADTNAGADTCRVALELGFNSTMYSDYGAPARVTAQYSVDPVHRRINVSLTWHNKTATRVQEALTVFNRPARRAGYRWEIDQLGEWVASSNVTQGGNQYQRAAWSGIRYTTAAGEADGAGEAVEGGGGGVGEATGHKAVARRGLWIDTLDAGMICPALNKVADGNLTDESSLYKACFDYNIRSKRDPSQLQKLNDTMIDGLGINLHQNRMTISGFPQWYPIGVGALYQKNDETTQFRFVIEER